MIVRVVVAVALTTALLAASAPGLRTARVEHTDGEIERQVQSLSAELSTFVTASDATRTGSARRVVTVRLPARSLTTAGVSSVRFHEHSGVGVVSWQVTGGKATTERLVDVPLLAPGGELKLRESGPHRLVFSLSVSNGRRVLRVERLTTAAGDETDA